MKKVMIASAALFFAAITSVNAQTTQPATDKKEVATATTATAVATPAPATVVAQAPVEKNEAVEKAQPAQPTKTQVKSETLPDAVKATIAGDEFKGWVVSSAFLVKATTEYYELVLTKEKETKTVKLDKAGKLI